jgi:hypothetical protein
VKQGGRFLKAIAFDFADRIDEFAPGSRIDLVISIEEDEYSASRGYQWWSARIKDARPAGMAN